MTVLTVLILISTLLPAPSIKSQESRERIATKHLERARSLELENNPKAEDEYRLAIRARAGRYPEALRELSFYLERRMRFSESAAALEKYISQTPLQQRDDDIQELSELREAATLKLRIDRLKKPPLQDLVEYSRLVSRYADNQFLDALPYAESAVRLYPDCVDAYLALVRALIGPGQEERRCKMLQRAVALGATSPSHYFDLGNCELVIGHMQAAAAAFQKTLDISNAEFTDAYEGLGLALAQLGRRTEAIAALRRYLELAKIPEQERPQLEQRIKRHIEQLEKDQ